MGAVGLVPVDAVEVEVVEPVAADRQVNQIFASSADFVAAVGLC